MLQDNYYPMDYNAVHVNYEKKNAENHNRYVKFEHRENRTVLDHDMFKVLTSGKLINCDGVVLVRTVKA